MKKLITTFVTGCLVLWTSFIIAQPTFTFSPQDTSAAPGETLTFQVSVTDFTDILSFQYSMNWDPNVLDFVSVDNITTDLASFAQSSFGTTQTGDGKLSVNWFDPNVSGVSLNNGTVLYTLTFDVLSADGTDLAFTSDPTVIEIVDSNGNDIGMIAQNATVNGGSPGGGGGNSSDLILTASQINAANGDQICLDVSVENFNNILSMQYSMNFDENVIEYTNVSNLNLQDLAPSNFGTTMASNGILTLSWFDNTNATGVTVPDGTVIFQVCFDVIGSMGENSSFDFTNSPTIIEIFDGNNNQVSVSSNSGAVNVTSGGGNPNPNPDGLIVTAPIVTGDQGTNICLDVSVDNFDNILSMQFSMNFDETVLDYTGVSNINLQDLAPSNFGTTMTDDGVLTLSWFDNTNASGVTVSDGTVIFQVCFDIIGSNGDNSPFNFTSTPTVIEVFDGDSKPVDFNGNNGSVTVGDGGNPPPPPSDDGLINASDHYPMEDEEFCMDIYVSDFDNILSMQFSMNFDPNELEFVEIMNPNTLPDLLPSAFNTGNADIGQISLAWFDQTTEGISLDDGTVIFQVCFKTLGSCGTVTNLEFTNDPIPIEVIDGDENEVTFTSNPGVVDICGSPPLPSIVVNASDYQADEDEEFCIDISVDDFNDIASMAYSMNFDPNKVEFQSIQLTNNLTGLDMADFDVDDAVNGNLTLSWQEMSGDTLANGTVIYQVCFKSLVACGTASSNFVFSDTPTAIAVTDGNGDPIDLSSNNGVISSCNNTPPPTPADEFIVASDHQPLEGEEFCMDISVNDFNNIVSMQYSMSFDPNELEFQSIEVTGNLSGLAVSNFGTNDAPNGSLTVSWLDPNVAGITLADGTVIYQVCFKVLGSCGTLTNFEFVNSPTVIEVTDGDGNLVIFDSNPGVVDICGDGTTPPPPTPADEFIVASDHQPLEGEEFCMDISVNDFNNIVSMQYSMSFDPNELEFQSIEVTGNLSGLAVSNFGTNDAPNGSLTVSWLDPNVAGITLADGTVIYQVCFKVLGSCGTLTNFEFVNSPTVIEVTDGDGNLVNFDSNPGVVDICGTTPDASISINASDYKADEGESFCIDISVSDFDNIASLEYSMEFDATKVEFQSIQLTNNLTGLDISDFVTTNASNGVLTLSWQEASGITIADGTVIYQVCFKSLAACGTASSNFDFTNTPTAISVTDGNGDSVNLSSNNGTISFCDDITPPPPAPDEFMVASDHQPLEGEDFCMDISVNDFTNIVSMQYSMSFDPNELEFQSIQVPGNLDGLAVSNFGVNDAGNGIITVSWLDPNVSGITLADGTIIFQVCFKTLGSCGTVTNFEFTDSPTVIEITDGDGNIVDFSSDPGIVDICGAPAIPFILTAAQNDVPEGETVCIPITAQGFEDIVSMQYTITFDPALFEFTGTQAYNLVDLAASNFGISNVSNGVITFSWLDSTTGGVTVPDNTAIYEICFKAIGNVGDVSPVTFSSNPTTIEIGKPNGTIVPTLNNGSVTIITGCPGPIIYDPNITEIQNVSCNGGTDGVIDITIDGGDGSYTYEWKNNSGVVVSTAPNFVGGAGTYSLSVSSCGDNVSISETFTLTEPDAIDVIVTSVQDVDCFGDQNGFIMTDPSGGTSSYTYAWSNGGANISQFSLAGGMYTFTVTDSKGCEYTSDFIEVLEPAELIATASVVNPPCFGDNGSISVAANGGSLTYEYSNDNGGTWQTSSSFTNVTEGTYKVLVRDNKGCVTTISPDVVVDAPDELSITLNSTFDSGNCIGSAAVQVSGGNAITDYFWSGPNSNYFNSPNQSGLCAGQHCVIVQDVNGCQTSECVYVSRQLIIAGTVTNACWGINNGEISVLAQGGVPPNPTYTYVWDPQVPNPGSPTQVGLSPGTYCVTVTSMPDNQMETMCFNVSQAAEPVQIGNADLNDPTGPNLFNGSIQVSGITGGFGGPYTYKWDPNLGSGPVLNNLDEGAYNLTVCDVNGCNISASYVLEIVPTALQFSTFDFQDANCSDSNDGTFTFAISGGLPNYSVTVTGPSGQVYSNLSLGENQVITIDNLPSGNYTINADFNVAGYTGDIDANFTIDAPAPIVIESLKIQNATEDAAGRIFIDIEGGDSPYTYFWNNASTSKDLFDVQPGPYSVTVTDQSSCTAEFGPFVVDLFEVDGATTVDVDCPNEETGSITPNIVGVAGDPTCEWVGPNGEIYNTCNLVDLPSGIYTLVVTDTCGVETPEYQFEIQANSDISVVLNPTTNSNGVNIACFGGSDGGAIAVVTGGLPPLDYIWSNGETDQEISNIPAGNYSVTVIDALGCEDNADAILTEPLEALSAELGGVVSPSCTGAQNGSATIIVSGGTPFPGANPYLYQWNDTQSQTGPTAILLKAGDYAVTVTDRNGCQVIVPVTIADPDKMEVTITTTCDNGDADGTALANVFGGTGPFQFTWSNADTAQFITGLTAGTYFVEVSDGNGCQATDINGGFVCPNFGCFEARTVITPDGDGRNEEFIIGCTSRFPNNTLEIFNRWGQLVFETDDYVCEEADLDGCWEGTNARGDDLPEGVYFYIFDYTDPVTNEEDQKKGSVTILRQ